MIKDPVLGPVGAVVPFLINVILGKEIAIMILTALVIWNVVLTIVVPTFQQALIVALLPRQKAFANLKVFVSFQYHLNCVIFNLF